MESGTGLVVPRLGAANTPTPCQICTSRFVWLDDHTHTGHGQSVRLVLFERCIRGGMHVTVAADDSYDSSIQLETTLQYKSLSHAAEGGPDRPEHE